MTALNRTVSLVEMHDIAVLIAQHLNFDMFRLFQILLDKDIVDAESFSRFALRVIEFGNQIFRISYDTHPASAAAGRRFQHNRITAEFSEFLCVFFGFNRLFHARNSRDADLMSYQFRFDLIAQLLHHLVSRSDKFDTCVFALLCKITVLGKESITRMNCVRAFRLREIYDFVDAQIGIYRTFSLADLIRLVGLRPEKSVFIFFRINRDRSDTELATGSEYSDRNFASVRHEDLFKLLHFIYPPHVINNLTICYNLLSYISFSVNSLSLFRASYRPPTLSIRPASTASFP